MHATGVCGGPDGEDMPSLFRFLFVLMILGGIGAGGLYVLATYFEPEQKEISKPVRDIELEAK